MEMVNLFRTQKAKNIRRINESENIINDENNWKTNFNIEGVSEGRKSNAISIIFQYFDALDEWSQKISS